MGTVLVTVGRGEFLLQGRIKDGGRAAGIRDHENALSWSVARQVTGENRAGVGHEKNALSGSRRKEGTERG